MVSFTLLNGIWLKLAAVIVDKDADLDLAMQAVLFAAVGTA